MQTLKIDLIVYLTERQEFGSVISDTSQLLGHDHMTAFALTKKLEANAGGIYLRASHTNESQNSLGRKRALNCN